MQLEINDVSKTYREGKQAVANVSMRIGPGVLGLLGAPTARGNRHVRASGAGYTEACSSRGCCPG
jgi:ABC-type uncharacterized transport system ATPase subunit